MIKIANNKFDDSITTQDFSGIGFNLLTLDLSNNAFANPGTVQTYF